MSSGSTYETPDNSQISGANLTNLPSSGPSVRDESSEQVIPVVSEIVFPDGSLDTTPPGTVPHVRFTRVFASCLINNDGPFPGDGTDQDVSMVGETFSFHGPGATSDWTLVNPTTLRYDGTESLDSVEIQAILGIGWNAGRDIFVQGSIFRNAAGVVNCEFDQTGGTGGGDNQLVFLGLVRNVTTGTTIGLKVNGTTSDASTWSIIGATGHLIVRGTGIRM